MFILKVKILGEKGQGESVEEIEVDINQEEVLSEVELSIRVVISEDKRFSLIIKKAANDKIKMVAEELAELLSLSKYALTFFYKGEKITLNDRLGDREIGGKAIQNNGNINTAAEQ